MDAREAIIAAGQRLLRSGLTVETWGNISLREAGSGRIYITPSGMAYDTLRPEDVVVLDEAGNILEGTRRPSIESALHCLIYQHRRDVNAIVHTHPIHSQVFALLGEDIPAAIDEAAQVLGGAVRCARYALPGTKELAENALAALGEGQACLLANHGAVGVGADMDTAFRVCTVLEMTAQIYYMARSIGQPRLLAPETVEAMRHFALHGYGQGR